MSLTMLLVHRLAAKINKQRFKHLYLAFLYVELLLLNE